jgi:hypothetical protein
MLSSCDNTHRAKKSETSRSEKRLANREIMTTERPSLGTYDMIQIEYVSADLWNRVSMLQRWEPRRKEEKI